MRWRRPILCPRCVHSRDESGIGFLIIEHDMGLIMPLCERIQVIDYGRTVAIGSPGDIRTNPAVLSAYLGSRKGRRSRS